MKEYSEELIEDIKQNVNMVDFIGEYVDLTKKGKDYFGKCPFHDERTASFCVSPHKHKYFCFGCKEGGDIIQFCHSYLDMSYDQAVEYLGQIAGLSTEKTNISLPVKFLRKTAKKKKRVKVVAEKHRILDKSYLDRFEKRKITKWIEEGIPQYIMDRYEVMYDSKAKRIVYPVYDSGGNLINVKGRTIIDNYKNLNIPKFINYEPVGDLDYFQGWYQKRDIVAKSGEIIVFESLKSVMKADAYGIENTVSAETSYINIFQVKLLIRTRCDVVIAFDSDVPLSKIKNNDCVKTLCQFTNVYVVIDTDGLLGDKAEKNSPIDKGKEIWDELYEKRIKL